MAEDDLGRRLEAMELRVTRLESEPSIQPVFAGVCAGIARRNGSNPVWLRLAFLVGAFIWGIGILAYCCCLPLRWKRRGLPGAALGPLPLVPVQSPPAVATPPSSVHAPEPAYFAPGEPASPKPLPWMAPPARVAPLEPATPEPLRPAGVPAPAPQPKPDLEWRVGATWLNRLGAAAILLAAAFFLSYSFKQGWITPAMQCLMGGAFSLALVGAGERLRRRGQRGFSQGITAAGIGIAYVSAYAAHALYHLIPLPAAFALMTAATLLSILVAAWGEAQAVAVLGYLGAVVTPLLLRTGKDPILSLALYLVVLSAGAVFQGRKRGWAVVRWVAWAGSALLLSLWTLRYLGPGSRVPFTAGVLAIALAYQWDAVTRLGRDARTADAVLLALNALLATAGIYVAWDAAFPHWMGTLAMSGAALQSWSGWKGWLRDRAHPAPWVLVAHAASLIAVAVPLQFDGKGVAIGWAAQVLVAAWAARQYGQRWLALHAVGTAVLSIWHLAAFELSEKAAPFLTVGPWEVTTPLVACAGVAAACLGAAVLASGWTGYVLGALATVAAFLGCFGRLEGFAGTLPAMAWAGAVFAALMHWPEGRRLAFATLALAAVKLWAVDVALQEGWKAAAVDPAVFNLRMLCVAGSAAVFAYAGLRGPSATAFLLAAISSLAGVSLEIHRLFTGAMPELGFLPFDERFVFTALWAAGAMALPFFAGRIPNLRPWAWAAAWLVLAKFWLSDVMLRGGWEALSVPRLGASPRTAAAVASAAMLAALALRDRGASLLARGVAGVAACLTVLGWVSLEVHRAWVGMVAEPPRLSDGEQIAHSAAWALGAGIALAVGFARDLRAVRIGGLCGIAVVAAKILFVDLSEVAAIYRVGILFVLGVLSLAGSWAYHRRGKEAS